MQWQKCTVITGPPNGPVLFSSLASVGVSRRCLLSSSVVCNAAGGPGTWAVRWPTKHGGPVRLRPVRVTLCNNNENNNLIYDMHTVEEKLNGSRQVDRDGFYQ